MVIGQSAQHVLNGIFPASIPHGFNSGRCPYLRTGGGRRPSYRREEGLPVIVEHAEHLLANLVV